MTPGPTFAKLIREVKEAILAAQELLDTTDIQITKVDLEVKATVKKVAEIGGKLPIVSVELSGRSDESNSQTISLSLTPQPALETMGSLEQELSEAIKAIGEAISEAASTLPLFGFNDATLSVGVTYSKEGKLKIIAGGSAEQINAHTIKITFGKRS